MGFEKQKRISTKNSMELSGILVSSVQQPSTISDSASLDLCNEGIKTIAIVWLIALIVLNRSLPWDVTHPLMLQSLHHTDPPTILRSAMPLPLFLSFSLCFVCLSCLSLACSLSVLLSLALSVSLFTTWDLCLSISVLCSHSFNASLHRSNNCQLNWIMWWRIPLTRLCKAVGGPPPPTKHASPLCCPFSRSNMPPPPIVDGEVLGLCGKISSWFAFFLRKFLDSFSIQDALTVTADFLTGLRWYLIKN